MREWEALDRSPNLPVGTIIVATGRSRSAAVPRALRQVALETALGGSGPVEVLSTSRTRDPFLRHAESELIQTLTTQLPGTSVVTRPIRSRRRGDCDSWIDVPTPPGSIRFDVVRVPAWWRDSGRRCLVCRIGNQAADASDRPLVRLAALAHPRQRLAARLSRDQGALTAELAAPWQPRLILTAGTWRAQRVAIVTFDLISAELTWLALAERALASAGIGPWEDPAVQHATVLELGASGPHQVRCIAAGDAGDFALVDYLGQRLGVPSSPGSTAIDMHIPGSFGC